MRELKKIADGLSEPMRMSSYLKSVMKLSATLISRVKFGGVFLNGNAVTMRAEVKNGDEIKVLIGEKTGSNITPKKMTLDFIYEDEYILAVNKPKNMPTHPSRGNHLPTLAEGLVAHYGDGFVFRAITRLDRDTSGIVLVAKDAFSASRLSAEMKKGGFKKRYLAIVEGIPLPNEGIIDAPIERECEGSIKRVVREDGKASRTKYRAVKSFENSSLCDIELFTGRTHQIRVHMAHIGHPLVGDFLYGTESHEGYFLHCYSLSFHHPITEKQIELTCIPEKYRDLNL